MALFPAYANNKSSETIQESAVASQKSDQPLTGLFGWLENASYTSHNEQAFADIREQTLDNDDKATVKSDQDLLGVEDEDGEQHLHKNHEEIYEKILEPVRRKHKRKQKDKSRKHPNKRFTSDSGAAADTPISSQNKDSIIDSGKKIFIEDVGLRPEHAFRIDRKPDRNNLAFSSFSHNQLPKYIRLWTSSVLGITSGSLWWLQLEEKGSGKKSKVVSKKQRYYFNWKTLNDDTEVTDLTQCTQESFTKSAALPQRLSLDTKKISSDVNPLGIYDQATTFYLQGKGPIQAAASEGASKSGEDDEIYKETREQYLKRRTTEQNKYLRENPHDVKKWIEFAKFQYEAMTKSEFVSTMFQTSTQRKIVESALLEKKLAILDRAIEFNPKSVELLVYKFVIGQELWENDKIMSQWKQVVFRHPNNIKLWEHYLTCLRTKFSAFSVSKYTKLYAKCMDMLKKIHEGTFQSHSPLQRHEEGMIDVVTTFCHHLCNSGFRERAIAIFQALIEFNFFSPENLSIEAPLDDWLAFFEPFWDSGAPRFGELRAIGWRNSMKSENLAQANRSTSGTISEDNLVKPEQSKSQNWLRLEEHRERNHWLPWRMSELEDECEDPDRMVLFDDVSSSLFRVKSDFNRLLLLVRFLDILGVNLSDKTLFAQSRIDTSEILTGNRLFQWRYYGSSDRSSNILPLDPLFTPTSECHSFVTRVFEQSRLIMPQLRPEFKRYLSFLHLRFECERLELTRASAAGRFGGKAQLQFGKKFAKNLLKLEENRNNLRLWTEYAKLEWQAGNIKEARKIFDMVLSMQQTPVSIWNSEQASTKCNEILDLCSIYRAYAELELGLDSQQSDCHDQNINSDRVIWVLVSLATKGKFETFVGVSATASQILKAKRKYALEMENFQAMHENEMCELEEFLIRRGMSTDWIVCYAILEYITEGMQAATRVFEKALSVEETETIEPYSLELESSRNRRRLSFESLYLAYVKLHVFYSNQHSTDSLNDLRKTLMKALNLFPENEHFNNLLLDIELKRNLGWQLRTYFNDRLAENYRIGCVTVVFAIIAELERFKNIKDARDTAIGIKLQVDEHEFSGGIGIAHRFRTLFERIVNHPDLRHMVLTWRLYMKFEVLQNNSKNAKAVFYRAIQQCPWAKVLYMDAVRYFSDDLQEISDILTEKEIRVRAPLEEVSLLMEMDTTDQKVEDDSEMVEQKP